jgi:hypothetical protein
LSLRRGEQHSAVVERLRADLSTMRADLHETRSAPITSREAKAIARENVDSLAEKGAPGVLGTIHAGIPIVWPDVAVRGLDISLGGRATVPGVFAFIAWLGRDQLIARLESEIDGLADDGVALDAETRGYREQELMQKILETERQECEAIWCAEQAGVTIAYRDDVDLRAALCLADEVTQ